jgi:hypothetical protein
MSSVGSYKSQIPPFKFYATEAASAGTLYDETGAALSPTVPVNTTLRDMGKTVFLANGDILRKVQVLPVTDAAGSGRTGYIFLNAAPAAQNIVSLN